MGQDTGIEWCDSTWNPTRGCSRKSEGCRHCYAERNAARFSGPGQPYEGLITHRLKVISDDDQHTEARWNGTVRLVPERFADPIRWRRPRRIFINSMSDLFHESIPNEEIAAVLAVIGAAPQHTFISLTKRPDRMRAWFEWLATTGYAPGHVLAECLAKVARRGAGFDPRFQDQEWLIHLINVVNGHATWKHAPDSNPADGSRPRWPLPNLWVGASVENQAAADERISEILATPAAVRLLSCEPLLGPVQAKLTGCFHDGAGTPERPDELETHTECAPRIDWVIAGCESGPGARPCEVDWLRSLRDQCEEAGVAYFLKQARPGPGIGMGPGSHRKPGGIYGAPLLDDVQHLAFPRGAS
jgi:protein gp37